MKSTSCPSAAARAAAAGSGEAASTFAFSERARILSSFATDSTASMDNTTLQWGTTSSTKSDSRDLAPALLGGTELGVLLLLSPPLPSADVAAASSSSSSPPSGVGSVGRVGGGGGMYKKHVGQAKKGRLMSVHTSVLVSEYANSVGRYTTLMCVNTCVMECLDSCSVLPDCKFVDSKLGINCGSSNTAASPAASSTRLSASAFSLCFSAAASAAAESAVSSVSLGDGCLPLLPLLLVSSPPSSAAHFSSSGGCRAVKSRVVNRGGVDSWTALQSPLPAASSASFPAAAAAAPFLSLRALFLSLTAEATPSASAAAAAVDK
mmetsp:Transcript_19654/g.38931  ORF Transcript_19654/g.38931 Transcript_19654/m.38931 type:complete len:321 (-) Transcript_19654:1019-1981(-)